MKNERKNGKQKTYKQKMENVKKQVNIKKIITNKKWKSKQ